MRLVVFNEKYQWPEAGMTRLEISPVSHTAPMSPSSSSRAWRLRRLTV
ncbi:hypothetical protein MBH78_20970 [Oceanimonas sp. NS1]|nr:hypothetical protein [Oceanimonas sp. NS1]